MGHFTALVPSGNNRQQRLVIPLTDNNGHVLPICFLLQAEEQNTFHLLEQYLHVIQQYSSSLDKQIPVAVIALREAPHMQHLVQAYIDMSLTMFNEQNHAYYTQSQPPATSQGKMPRNPCVGCDTEAFGSAETNFLCSVCYKNQTSAVAVAGYNSSQGYKCRSPGCQQHGLSSKDGKTAIVAMQKLTILVVNISGNILILDKVVTNVLLIFIILLIPDLQTN